MSTVSVCQQRPPSAPPAAPRFENRECDLCHPRGEKKTDSPTHLKVANRSELEAETLSRGLRHRRRGSEASPLGSTQRGAPSGRFFGDFLIGEKVTRGAEHGKAMLSRSARIRRRRSCQLHKILPGRGAERPKRWVLGLPAPHKRPSYRKNTSITGTSVCGLTCGR